MREFSARVEALVAQIPKGRVMTYGQLAALAGNPRAARIVGGIAHYGNPELPWQRVVNKHGGLASGYPGGKAGHRAHLEAEGITVTDDYQVDIVRLLWQPPEVRRQKMEDSKNPNATFQMPPSKLVVIVGPTASGKSALAIEIARKYSGEIICADSRTVYKDMNIGTAKPSKQDRAIIPHHLLDVVELEDTFTVADFKRMTDNLIIDITQRGKVPIMVGGSGLYVDAVLFNYAFSGSNAPKDAANNRHLDKNVPAVKEPLRENTIIIGLEVPRDVLRERIAARIDAMVEAGLVDEVARLQEMYPNSKALLAPGYKAFNAYINREVALEEAKTIFVRNDMQLAKRQMTWFRRNKSIHWTSDLSKAEKLVSEFLNKSN